MIRIVLFPFFIYLDPPFTTELYLLFQRALRGIWGQKIMKSKKEVKRKKKTNVEISMVSG